MLNYKLILYAIYFILLDTNIMNFHDAYDNSFHYISLIFVTLSIIKDIYDLFKKYKKKQSL